MGDVVLGGERLLKVCVVSCFILLFVVLEWLNRGLVLKMIFIFFDGSMCSWGWGGCGFECGFCGKFELGLSCWWLFWVLMDR